MKTLAVVYKGGVFSGGFLYVTETDLPMEMESDFVSVESPRNVRPYEVAFVGEPQLMRWLSVGRKDEDVGEEEMIREKKKKVRE